MVNVIANNSALDNKTSGSYNIRLNTFIDLFITTISFK